MSWLFIISKNIYLNTVGTYYLKNILMNPIKYKQTKIINISIPALSRVLKSLSTSSTLPSRTPILTCLFLF